MVAGGSAVFTAAITSTGTGTPTGTVQFYANGQQVGQARGSHVRRVAVEQQAGGGADLPVAVEQAFALDPGQGHEVGPIGGVGLGEGAIRRAGDKLACECGAPRCNPRR